MPRNLSDLWLNEWRGRNINRKKLCEKILQDNSNITRLFWNRDKQKKIKQKNIITKHFILNVASAVVVVCGKKDIFFFCCWIVSNTCYCAVYEALTFLGGFLIYLDFLRFLLFFCLTFNQNIFVGYKRKVKCWKWFGALLNIFSTQRGKNALHFSHALVSHW